MRSRGTLRFGSAIRVNFAYDFSNVAVRCDSLPESVDISRDQSLYPDIFTPIVCLPGFSLSVAGLFPKNWPSTYTSAPSGLVVKLTVPMAASAEGAGVADLLALAV